MPRLRILAQAYSYTAAHIAMLLGSALISLWILWPWLALIRDCLPALLTSL